MKTETKHINNKQLTDYIEIKNKILTTTAIIKDSFKNAFEYLDNNGFVIIKNNRRDKESILIDIQDYNSLLRKIDDLEEKLFDKWAESQVFDDKDLIRAEDVDI